MITKPHSRSGAIPVEELPQFEVSGLLQVALRQIESADQNVLSGSVVQAARQRIIAMLATHAIAERNLGETAKSLAMVKDHHVESARLALMTAAAMLRPESPSGPQPEIPKVGSTDAPGG
jgi:hypothetical protein